jgi:hypothetical protein
VPGAGSPVEGRSAYSAPALSRQTRPGSYTPELIALRFYPFQNEFTLVHPRRPRQRMRALP